MSELKKWTFPSISFLKTLCESCLIVELRWIPEPYKTKEDIVVINGNPKIN